MGGHGRSPVLMEPGHQHRLVQTASRLEESQQLSVGGGSMITRYWSAQEKAHILV